MDLKFERKDLLALALTIWIVVFICGVIYFAALPFIVNTYLDRQPVYTISQAQDYVKPPKGLYGQVIVVNGTVGQVFGRPDDFIITDGRHDIMVYGTNRLNCIPIKGSVKKIAGAWNPTDAYGMNNRFYGVWVLGGC